MAKVDDLGVIIACYPGDLWIAKASLASINYFAPDLPIAIIADNDPKLDKILLTYNIKYVIRKSDVKNDYLRNNCFGTRFTSAIALFESPFRKFLYLDADTILWGNIFPELSSLLDQFDFVVNSPHEPYTDFILKTQYFDYEKIFGVAPYFPWKDHHYFNSGVMAGKQGVLDLDLFILLHKLWKKDKSLIFEIQGVVNFIVYYLKSKSQLAVGETLLQEVIPVKDPSELREDFPIVNGKPVVKKKVVLHYAGVKPMIKSYKGYLDPVIYFRLKFLHDTKSFNRFFGRNYLILEEYLSNFRTYYDSSLIKYVKFLLTGKK